MRDGSVARSGSSSDRKARAVPTGLERQPSKTGWRPCPSGAWLGSRQDVRWLFDDAFKHNFQDVPHDFFETQEQAHGRLEIRRCWVLSELSYIERHNWPGLERVVLIESERTVKGVTSVERRFYLSGLTEGAAVTLSTVRAHWGVENRLHWVLDVIFAEDSHQVRSDHAAANLGVLRRWALNLLRLTPSPRKNMSLKNKRPSPSGAASRPRSGIERVGMIRS